MMEQQHRTLPDDQPFSFRNEWNKLLRYGAMLLGYWRWLLAAAVIGMIAGGAYRWWKPVSYTARISFVVEESSKMGGGSIASALAGQFGLDIGSLGGGSSGILSGDNVMELVKSHSLIRKTLLSPYDSGSAVSLADVYAESKKWKRKWEKKLGRQISFPANAKTLARTEDSLLQKITTEILGSNLNINKPDKKMGFFELNVSSLDEKFSLLFSQRLLKASTDLYVETKTKRQVNNVARLQRKADSLAIALNRKTYSAADADRQLLDANPIYASPTVSAEIQYRDKLTQGVIYSKIVENLELSKMALIQETPTIQVVDEPELPLKDNRLKLIVALLAGAMIAVVITGIGVMIVGTGKTS